MNEYLNKYQHNSTALIDLSNCLTDNDVIILTTIPNELMGYIDETYLKFPGLNIYATFNNSNENLFTKCRYSNYQLFIPNSLLKYNNTNTIKIEGLIFIIKVMKHLLNLVIKIINLIMIYHLIIGKKKFINILLIILHFVDLLELMIMIFLFLIVLEIKIIKIYYINLMSH